MPYNLCCESDDQREIKPRVYRVMVFAQCTPYYCNKHTLEVPSDDKGLDTAHEPDRRDACLCAMGDPIVRPVFYRHIINIVESFPNG